MKKTKKIKEAKTLSVKKYTETIGNEQCDVVETTKQIDPDTDCLTTPWGTKIKADDIITVMEEYYSLSNEERMTEKEAWLDLINQIIGPRDDGKKITDIELAPDGTRNVTFTYEE